MFSLAGGGDDIVRFIFIYNAVFWWAFRSVILHYLLINLLMQGNFLRQWHALY